MNSEERSEEKPGHAAQTGRSVSREELSALLLRWQAGDASAAEVKAFAEAASGRDAPRDEILHEVVAELDVLEVHLLTVEDVPALLAFLAATDFAAARDTWTRHRDAIDLDARSKRLKKIDLYRPFCR